MIGGVDMVSVVGLPLLSLRRRELRAATQDIARRGIERAVSRDEWVIIATGHAAVGADGERDRGRFLPRLDAGAEAG